MNQQSQSKCYKEYKQLMVLQLEVPILVPIITDHNSPMSDECQTQSALILPWERAWQDNAIYNDTSEPMCAACD